MTNDDKPLNTSTKPFQNPEYQMPDLQDIFVPINQENIANFPKSAVTNRISETILIMPNEMKKEISFEITQFPLPFDGSDYLVQFLNVEGEHVPRLGLGLFFDEKSLKNFHFFF